MIEFVGYFDENGSVRCIPCADAFPDEEWSEDEAITESQVRVCPGPFVCGICGEDLQS